MTNDTSFKEGLVRQLAEILNDTNLTEIEYEVDQCRIRVAREIHVNQVLPSSVGSADSFMPQQQAPFAQTQDQPASVLIPVATDPAVHPGAVKAPMVGTTYLSASPEADAFVKIGDKVEVGQTLLIIEAMKVMNQIKAPAAGTVKEILVHDTDPIEFDQPLLIIE